MFLYLPCFMKHNILLFTSSLLPCNYLFFFSYCRTGTGDSSSSMLFWSFIILHIFKKQQQQLNTFFSFIIFPCSWAFLFSLNSLYFSHYLNSKLIWHLTNYLSIFSTSIFSTENFISSFSLLLHWEYIFSETA